jgi:SAM-dependent methyltransferase
VSQVPGSVGGPPATFDCLWCGTKWTTRSPDDLEGWARLCPDCLGRAGDNPFLRFRLRDALTARAAAGGGTAQSEIAPPSEPPPPTTPAADRDAEMIAYYEARAGEYDDWYLRRGRYARGPIHDAAWDAELDGAGTWLDGLPIRGEIVELAGGTGWWSPLLASKGELSIYDAAEAPLERARERLVAHRLRAHLHVRDAWTEPDRQVDALFFGFWLSHVPRDRTDAFLALARRWLKPDGIVAFIDSLPDPQSGAADNDPPDGDLAVRRLADGREFTVVKVFREPAELEEALIAAGFRGARVTTTGRFFVLGEARA